MKSSDIRTHVNTREEIFSWKERRKGALGYFVQIMNDMKCGTFREVKELRHGMKLSGGRKLRQTSPKTVYLMMIIIHRGFLF